MASEIKLPELGENLTEGAVLDVKVAAGDTVARGQTLLEVEAEKSTVEVPSPLAGRVQQMLVKKGDAIKVGQTLCTVDEGAHSPAEAAKPQQKKAADISRKEQAESREQGKTGERVEPSGDGQKAESSKAAPKPQTETREETPVEAKPARAPASPAAQRQLTPAGPATRRLARELGIDLSQVHGTASGGRVTSEDVKAHVRALAAGQVSGRPGIQAPPLPDFARWGEVERKPLDGVRRKTAEHMSLGWSQIPHVTHNDVADITDLEAFRKEQEGRGPKLTITAFALKAAAIALRQFSQFNASLDLAANQLILKHYYHIGVAVDTDRGLLVPVLRDVDKKSVHQLAEELISVAEWARQKKLQVEEMRGGTFTITNLGGIGGTGFSPIVNYPEVAILGLSRSRLQPVVRDGQFVPRLLVPLSLSYDHRVIDGAAAARFTRRIAEMLENPLVMLLDA